MSRRFSSDQMISGSANNCETSAEGQIQKGLQNNNNIEAMIWKVYNSFGLAA